MAITNSDNSEFDNYLKRLGYKFKNENQEFGGYIILKNKKICLTMDVDLHLISNSQKIINQEHYHSK